MTLQSDRRAGAGRSTAPARAGARAGSGAPGTRRGRRTPREPGGAMRLVCGAAWAVLVVGALPIPIVGSGSVLHLHGGADAAGGPEGSGAAAASVVVTPGWIAGWALMVVAMMWPLMVPLANRIATGAFVRWRIVLPVVAVAVSTALWVGFGVVAGLIAQLAAVPVGSLWWQLLALVVAAVATRSAWRARLLARCQKTPPIAPGGRRGIRSAAVAGFAEWRRCAVLCGPLMLAMVPGHGLVVLAAASLAVWWEARHPRAWRDRMPPALIVVAALGAVGTALLGVSGLGGFGASGVAGVGGIGG
ncbi:DUF2182 domain-containing protein [Agromyces sp. NPDC058110]|uniref:copper chaperone n=1 Tax=Agromyces sp. NPDC058110 TaxID=3346345 RepID=UPI0036DD238A